MKTRTLAIMATTAAVLATTAVSQDVDRTGWPTSFTVGTASQGGTFFIYGSGWANLVQEKTGVNASSEVTGGPVQNLALVQNRQVDFAMTTMGPAYEAWTGNSPIAPGVEMKNIRATFPMYQTPFEIIALKSKGIASIKDLQGKKVGVGPRGGTPGTYWPLMFKELGINVSVQYGGAADLGTQLQDGLIDAFAFAAGLPIPNFAEIEAQQPANIFAFTPEEQAKIAATFPSVSPYTIPGGIYRGTPEPRASVAMWNFGIVHKDLPESLVYEVMKTVLDNNDRMKQIHPAAAETLVENWDKNKFMWFHPGAVRYFTEKGITLPAAVLPPSS